MKNLSRFFPSIIILAVLLLLIFSIHVPAQSVGENDQLLLQMISYARKTETALKSSRQRVVDESNSLIDADETAATGNFENPTVETLALEKQAFEILNQKRLGGGLEPLLWNDKIAALARLHSENMARLKFFSHAGRDGKLVNDRADALGINDWRSIGENIAFNKGFKKPAESACEQWMASPAHRANILNQKWSETGIGMAIAPDGSYYFTQVFILK